MCITLPEISAVDLKVRTCESKKPFRQPKDKTSFYRCPYCRKWHITSSQKNSMNPDSNIIFEHFSLKYIERMYRLYVSGGAKLNIVKGKSTYYLKLR